MQPYFCCPRFLCTRVGSCCIRVMSHCICVVSCCRVVLMLCRVVLCCTHVVSCCLVLLLVQFSRLDPFYLAQVSIIKRRIEKYFLTVLLISELVKDLMNHFYDHKQKVFCFCVMYIYRRASRIFRGQGPKF